MNEEENVLDEDIIDLTDIDDENVEENDETGTPTDSEETQPTEQETNATNEVDDNKFLDFINSKEIVYNGEKVKIDDLDSLISTYQKGLNYDKVKSKADSLDDEIVDYIRTKAQEHGWTEKEYIQRVKAYEEDQRKQQTENEIQKLVGRGLDEETARRVAETEAFREQLKSEKANIEKQKAEIKAKEDKDKEYEEFLKLHPDIKPSDIPAEVFKEAETKGLISAYEHYENKQLKEKIKILEQNKNNASNSVVTSTSNGSSTEQMSKDAFFEGFDSE